MVWTLWNAASVYPSDGAWESEADLLLTKLDEARQMEGPVGKSAKTLAEALKACYALIETLGKLLTYAFNSQAVDNADTNAARMSGKAQSIPGQLFAGIGFIQPEMLGVDPDLLAKWR